MCSRVTKKFNRQTISLNSKKQLINNNLLMLPRLLSLKTKKTLTLLRKAELYDNFTYNTSFTCNINFQQTLYRSSFQDSYVHNSTTILRDKVPSQTLVDN